MASPRITSNAKILTAEQSAQKPSRKIEARSSAAADERPRTRAFTAGDVFKSPLGKSAATVAPELLALANTINTAAIIFWTAIGFYVFQFALWAMGIAGLALGAVPVVSFVVPGKEFYMATWALIAIIGISSMAYSVFMFLIRGVPCFDGWKGLIFILCSAGYLTVFINLIPWFAVWVGTVVWIEKIRVGDAVSAEE